MRIGTVVILTREAREGNYAVMPWKYDVMMITDRVKKGTDYLYSSASISNDVEITCSISEKELKEVAN